MLQLLVAHILTVPALVSSGAVFQVVLIGSEALDAL